MTRLRPTGTERDEIQFELHRAKTGNQHWPIRAANGNILAISGTYGDRQDTINAADSLKKDAADAVLRNGGGSLAK